MAFGNEGLTAAKFDTNIRALRGTVMGLPVTNPSTESDFYVGLPSGSNAQPLGVLLQDVVEPGYPVTSATAPVSDPVLGTVNGSTPPAPFTSQGRAWALCTNGAEVEVIAADTTVVAGGLVIIADAYGRVTNCPAISGTTYYTVGRAKYASTAANQRVRISVELQTYKA